MRRRFRNAAIFSIFSLFVNLLWALALPAAAAAESLAIGSVGASFDSSVWKRGRIVEDMGPDQFTAADGAFLVVESFGLLEQRSDFEAKLELVVGNLKRHQPDLRMEPELGFERYDGFMRATRRVYMSEGGLDLFYQIDLISAGDGLAYVFISWTRASSAETHQARLEEVIDALHLPGEGTEWFAKSRPTPHRFEIGKWKIDLTFADSILALNEVEAAERRTLEGDEGNLAVHLIVEEVEGSADQVLKAVREAADEEGEYQEVERGDAISPIGKGRWLRMRQNGTATEMALAVFPLADGVWLDLRLVSNRAFRQRLWESLVQSLAVEREAEVDAFPKAAKKLAPQIYPNPAVERLVGESVLVAANAWQDRFALQADGLLVHDGRQLRRFALAPAAAPGAAPDAEELYGSEDYQYLQPLAWGDQILVLESGKAHLLADEELKPALFAAQRAAVAGSDLLVVRGAEKRALPGFEDLPVTAANALYLRNPAGTERRVAELADRDVRELAARPGEALVAAAPRDYEGEALAAPVELLRLDLAKGDFHPLGGRWISVRHLAAAEGGWLVSGQAADGNEGIFLLPKDGPAELLVAGDGVGLALEGGHLLARVDACPPLDERPAGHCVIRAPLALVREVGRHYRPFNAYLLNTIAGPARQRAGLHDASSPFPSTREAAAAYFAAADAIARERAGAPLPTAAADVDQLFDSIDGAHLSGDGATLLAVIVAEALVREGAVWVAPLGRPAAAGRFVWSVGNPFAVGVVPAGVVAAAGGEDGWVSPVSTLVEQAEGRTLLVGPDSLALRERLQAALPAGLPALLRQGKKAQLQELLESRRDNIELRRHVYRQLAALGRDELLVELSVPFAAAAEPVSLDVTAAAAARLARKPAPEAAEKVVADLRAGIVREPEEAELYLLLGVAYEATARPDRLALAKAAYQKAKEIQNWGESGKAAQAALARLEAKP